MNRFVAALVLRTVVGSASFGQNPKDQPPLDVNPSPITTTKAIHYDYDIVYVRAPRYGDDKQIAWSEVFAPLRAEPGADLMLLHPDGTEEILITAGDDAIPLWREAIADYRRRYLDLLLAPALGNLGKCLVKTGQFADAEPVLHESLAGQAQAKTPRSSPTGMETTVQLGASLLGQKKYAEAEKVLLGFFEPIGLPSEKNTFDAKVQPHVTEAVNLLACLYEETMRPDKTKEWRARLAK